MIGSTALFHLLYENLAVTVNFTRRLRFGYQRGVAELAPVRESLL